MVRWSASDQVTGPVNQDCHFGSRRPSVRSANDRVAGATSKHPSRRVRALQQSSLVGKLDLSGLKGKIGSPAAIARRGARHRRPTASGRRYCSSSAWPACC